MQCLKKPGEGAQATPPSTGDPSTGDPSLHRRPLHRRPLHRAPTRPGRASASCRRLSCVDISERRRPQQGPTGSLRQDWASRTRQARAGRPGGANLESGTAVGRGARPSNPKP